MDLLHIDQQESQKVWFGLDGAVDFDSAAHLAGQPVAWTVSRDDGSILACFGINETFENALGEAVQGVAWALLSRPIGADHLPLTRFVRSVVASSSLRRIELFAKAREGAVTIDEVMAEATAECRWAVSLGFTPAHVLRNFGAASETYMLFERLS
ncbi:MAG: hypothetical protein AAGE86_05765 [Pseudomonadota bacterium]